jgi:hypothetical protein
MAVKTALVFSTDENFAALAKGLVLSLGSASGDGEFALHMVDIGCSAATLDWMRAHGVIIGTFDRGKFIRRPKASLRPYQEAMLCRPFLRELFPGFDTYVWCDSDIWVQDIQSIRLYRDIANSHKDLVPVSPLIDVSYSYLYADFTEFVRYAQIWYRACYGETVASTYASRSVLSAGLFAMHASNPVWSMWATELDAVFQRMFASHDLSHLAEQTALNYLLYARKCFVPLDAIHNYNCHVGKLIRTDKGEVVIGDPPFRKVGVVHLTYSSKMMEHYISQSLLYDSGNYLSSEEIDQLRLLSHH